MIIVEKLIHKKLNKIIKQCGELDYKIIKHPTLNNNKAYIGCISEKDLDIITLKLLYNTFNNYDNIVINWGYRDNTIVISNKRSDIKTVLSNFNILSSEATWIYFNNIDKYDISNICYYFTIPQVRYSIKHGLKLPKTSFIYYDLACKSKLVDLYSLNESYESIFNSEEMQYIWSNINE